MLAEPAPSASVVIPVKDGARWLGEVLAAVSRRNWVLRSWSSTRARATTPWNGSRRRGFGPQDRAGVLRPRAHPQHGRAAHQRRAGRLSDPVRHARAGMSGRASRVPRALRSRMRGLRGPPAAARDLADDRPRADRVLRRLPRRPRRLGLPLQSQRQLQARLLRGGHFDDVAYSETRRSLEPCAPPATGSEKAYNPRAGLLH